MDARADRIARALARFRPEVRARVIALARRHDWVADLAVSFPALLFALAFPRAGVDARAALVLATTGAPLARIAAAAETPVWLRAFPPQAFAAPLPRLPDTPDFRRRIANHYPRNWQAAPRWIDNVAVGFETGDAEIALWFAREAPLKPPKKKHYYHHPRDRRRGVALWAWFCGQSDAFAHTFVTTPWRPEMQWKAALDATRTWCNTIEPALYLGDKPFDDSWLEDGEAGGYSFIALRSYDDLNAEAEAMKNCVRTFGQRIACNEEQVWSVTKNGERIATLSMARGMGPLPHITELSLAENKQAPLDMWLAARSWAHAQDNAVNADCTRFKYKEAQLDAHVWRKLWRPYWLAKRRIPDWLPLRPSETAFYNL